MKKINGLIVTVAVLVLIIVVESIILITGVFTKIPKNANGEDIVVSLNDGTNYSVDELYKELKKDYGLDKVINMIDNKILTKEYANKKDEVDKYANDVLVNLKANYSSDEELEEALQNYGYNSINDYLELIKQSKYKSYATDDYAKTLITDEDIKKYYNEKVYADIEGVHILVKPASTSTTDQDAAKKKAEEIIKAIKEDVKKGTSVEDAFKKYQGDTSVTYQNLGRYNYTEMDEAFSKAAYALKVNEVSGAVKSSFGYHVILKTKEYEKNSLEDEKANIIDKLVTEKTSSDTTLSAKALISIRTKYGLKINDSELEEFYNRYLNKQANTK